MVFTNELSNIFQIISIILEIIGLFLAFVEMYSKSLKMKIEKIFGKWVKFSKNNLKASHPIFNVGSLFVCIVGFLAFLIIDIKPTIHYWIGLFLCAIGSILILFVNIFFLVGKITKRRKIGATGLILASIGLVIEIYQITVMIV